MGQIDRAGTFRGRLESWAVTLSSGQFPQFEAKFIPAEMYNEETKEWEPWEYDQSARCYFVLFNKDKELLNTANIRRALGWTGQTFTSLSQGDWSGKVVQITFKENIYNERLTYRAEWIDAADADPNRQISALDPAKMADLEQRFAGRLSSGSTASPAAAPAKAPAAAPKTKAKPKAKPPVSRIAGLEDEEPEETPEPEALGLTAPAAAPKKAPPKAKGKAPAKLPAALPEECSKSEAWDMVSSLQAKTVSDDDLVAAWQTAIEEIAGPAGEDDLNPAGWATVRDNVLAKTAIF